MSFWTCYFIINLQEKDLQQDDQSTATHPDLDFDVEEVEEVTQELLRRGTVHELARSRSKPPPVEEKLLEEEGKLILKES